MLKDFNADKEKKFNSTVVLNHPVKRTLNVCVIGTIGHVEQAKAMGVDAHSLEEINVFAKEAKLVKKWARRYDVLLVSESLKRCSFLYQTNESLSATRIGVAHLNEY